MNMQTTSGSFSDSQLHLRWTTPARWGVHFAPFCRIRHSDKILQINASAKDAVPTIAAGVVCSISCFIVIQLLRHSSFSDASLTLSAIEKYVLFVVDFSSNMPLLIRLCHIFLWTAWVLFLCSSVILTVSMLVYQCHNPLIEVDYENTVVRVDGRNIVYDYDKIVSIKCGRQLLMVSGGEWILQWSVVITPDGEMPIVALCGCRPAHVRVFITSILSQEAPVSGDSIQL